MNYDNLAQNKFIGHFYFDFFLNPINPIQAGV